MVRDTPNFDKIWGVSYEEYYTEDLWERTLIETVSKDGEPWEFVHNHEEELEELKDEIIAELDDVDQSVSEYMFGEENHKEPEHEHSNDISMLPRPLSRKLVSLFALSVGIMETQVTDILIYELLREEKRSDSNAREVFMRNGFKSNIDLVNKLGLFEKEGHKGDIHDVRRFRNDLVHKPKERHTVNDLGQLKGRIHKAVRAPNHLHKIQDNVPTDIE